MESKDKHQFIKESKDKHARYTTWPITMFFYIIYYGKLSIKT